MISRDVLNNSFSSYILSKNNVARALLKISIKQIAWASASYSNIHPIIWGEEGGINIILEKHVFKSMFRSFKLSQQGSFNFEVIKIIKWVSIKSC